MDEVIIAPNGKMPGKHIAMIDFVLSRAATVAAKTAQNLLY
jgi:hypothetical protein